MNNSDENQNVKLRILLRTTVLEITNHLDQQQISPAEAIIRLQKACQIDQSDLAKDEFEIDFDETLAPKASDFLLSTLVSNAVQSEPELIDPLEIAIAKMIEIRDQTRAHKIVGQNALLDIEAYHNSLQNIKKLLNDHPHFKD